MRETFEETGIVAGDALLSLDSRASIPVAAFADTAHWPKNLFVVPEYAFGLLVSDTTVRLSDEHVEVAWLPFREAHERLTWDSNKVALWELEQRLTSGTAQSPVRTALGKRATMTRTVGDNRDISDAIFVENGPVDVDQLNSLYGLVGWDRANRRTAMETAQMLDDSRYYVSAHRSDLSLIGFARVCGDPYVAQVLDVITHPEWRRRGIATECMRRVVGHLRQSRYVTVTLTDGTGLDFYGRFDFKIFKDVARVWAPSR